MYGKTVCCTVKIYNHRIVAERHCNDRKGYRELRKQRGDEMSALLKFYRMGSLFLLLFTPFVFTHFVPLLRQGQMMTFHNSGPDRTVKKPRDVIGNIRGWHGIYWATVSNIVDYL